MDTWSILWPAEMLIRFRNLSGLAWMVRWPRRFETMDGWIISVPFLPYDV